MLFVALKLALHDRIRFAITVAGVAFAVVLVIVQVGLFLGILANATVTIENTRADLWVTSRNTPNLDFAHPFPEAYVQRVRGISGVSAADNLIIFYTSIALPNGAEETVLAYGVNNWNDWNLPWKIAEGNLSDLRVGRAMFLDDSATARFGPFAVSDYREVGGTRIRIVGRSLGAKSFTTVPVAFLEFHTLQNLMPNMDRNTTYILVKLEAGADAQVVAAEIRRRLPYNDVYTRDAWAQRTLTYWLESTGLGMNMYVTVFLGCLVGLVVVAQTLYSATMDHQKEFGTLKAIGGSNAEVYRILMWQAVVAAVVGFGVGLIPSYLARFALLRSANLEVRISPTFLATVFVMTIVMCVAASLISFRKIASLDPALVFRS